MIRGVRGARGVVPLDVLVGDARRKGHARALGPVKARGCAVEVRARVRGSDLVGVRHVERGLELGDARAVARVRADEGGPEVARGRRASGGVGARGRLARARGVGGGREAAVERDERADLADVDRALGQEAAARLWVVARGLVGHGGLVYAAAGRAVQNNEHLAEVAERRGVDATIHGVADVRERRDERRHVASASTSAARSRAAAPTLRPTPRGPARAASAARRSRSCAATASSDRTWSHSARTAERPAPAAALQPLAPPRPRSPGPGTAAAATRAKGLPSIG